jgi:hypothetical protein
MSTIQTSMPVAIFNRSTVVSDDEVETAVNALQNQVDNDLSKYWGKSAKLTFVPKGQKI